MSSGFGTFRSSNYFTSGYGRGYATAVVTQSINRSARTVTIKVRCLLTYYRNSGGNWNPGTGNIFQGTYSNNHMYATVDGSTASAGVGGQLGLKGRNQTLYVGNYYDVDGGNVQSQGTAVVEKSATFSYDVHGSAITKSWSAEINYVTGGSNNYLTCSGWVTTDSISPSGNPPSDLSVTNLSTTWNTVTGDFAVGNWGDSSSTRYTAARVFGPSGGARLENQFNGQTSFNTTITNSSVRLDGGIDIKGCGTYKVDLYAQNAIGSANTSDVTVHTPPAPGQFSYGIVAETAARKDYELSFVGIATNNVTTYDPNLLEKTIYYYDDVLQGWQILDMSPAGESITTPLVTQVTLHAQETMQLKGVLTYDGLVSEEVPLTLVNNSEPIGIYGGVSERDPVSGEISDPESKEVIKAYGSLSGETKKIIKIYASHEGVSREVFEDV